MKKTGIRQHAALLSLCTLLSGCASYQPLPLEQRPATLPAIPYARLEGVRLALPALLQHVFARPGQALDITDVVTLAVYNNPDLRAARNDAGIARAQAFSAALLPDPVLAISTEFKRSPDPGSTSGYSIGPSYDFGALLTHPALSAASAAETSRADLTLLWQEWQVIAQARLLFIRLTQGARLAQVLAGHRDYLAKRVVRHEEALRLGLVSVDTVAPVRIALQDLERQLADQEKLDNAARHELNQLLGLAPRITVPLRGKIGEIGLPAQAQDQVVIQLANLPARRPDLLALEYGYAAQDQRYRAAILAQFPALNIGLTRARDTSNVSSQGFSVSISLPVFNRNRGNIAIEMATRQKLHDDYQQRLDVARNDAHRLLAEQAINLAQLAQVERSEQQLTAQRQALLLASQHHAVDELLLTTADAALLSRQLEKVGLE